MLPPPPPRRHPPPPPPSPSPALATTEIVARGCQKLPVDKFPPAPPSLGTSDWEGFKFLAIPLVGYQGGAGALVSLPKGVALRLQVCAQGRAALWPVKHFPNPLRFAKPQSFKEALCYLLKPSFNSKKPPREDPRSWKLYELSGARRGACCNSGGEMNFTDWKVFGSWKKVCKISWPVRHQMCFAVAPGVWFFHKGCFELQILWMKSEISFLEIFMRRWILKIYSNTKKWNFFCYF